MNDLSRLDEDILPFHIIPRLDGETLIVLSSVSPELRLLIKNTEDDLWRKICTSTWPSLLCRGEVACEFISKFPGGYRSFYFQAFPSIDYHHPLPPPPPRSVATFVYAVDIFLGDEPFYTEVTAEEVDTSEYTFDPFYYQFKRDFDIRWHGCAVRSRKYFHLKKEGCKEYLENNMRFSCVVMEINKKRAGSLFNPSSWKPVSVKEQFKWPRGIDVVYETFMPAPGFYKETVKCEVKVECRWEEGREDRFYMELINFTMDDMNGNRLKERDASIIISNFIENGERNKKKKNNSPLNKVPEDY